MPTIRAIKSRIKSAQNIAQITKAMQMVAASKMRRAQDQASAGKPYANKLAEMLFQVASFTSDEAHPLLRQNESNKSLFVLFSSDRGLTGGLNTNLFKFAVEQMADQDTEVIAIGRKAREFCRKTGLNMIAEYTGWSDKSKFEQVLPIAETVIERYLDGSYGSIYMIYMQFLSTLSQKPAIQQLLPLAYHTVSQPDSLVQIQKEYLFEPSPKEIMEQLLPYYIEVELYQTLLEAKASEHSARMVSMKNASENAKDVISDLKLIYNKSRQASVTKELNEITVAMLSLAG